jgi:hypothetical protein
MRSLPALPVAVLLALALTPAQAETFTYQGLLQDSGTPADSYDFEVLVFATPDGGNPLVGPLAFDDVVLEQNRFTLDVDAGDIFTGPDRFLELRVRRGADSGGFTILAPRQPIRPTPYAQHARDADFAALVAEGSVGTAQLASQAVATTNLADGAVTRTKLADAAVNAAKIDVASVQTRVTGTCGANQAVAAIDAQGDVACNTFPVIPADTSWSRRGNAAIDPAFEFLGTTDAQPFAIRVQNAAALRIEPNAPSGAPVTANLIGGSAANFVAPGVRGAVIAGGGVSIDPISPALGQNSVFDHYGVVAGGVNNIAGSSGDPEDLEGFGAVVGGGLLNMASGSASVVGGGRSNTATGSESSVGGGAANEATALLGHIGGGESNRVTDLAAVVAGGRLNLAAGLDAAIGGGSSNTITVSGDRGVIAGGSGHTVSGDGGAVGGGGQNTAAGNLSTIAGGSGNSVSAAFGSVPGGLGNCAGGDYSVAAGRRAKVRIASVPPALGIGCAGVPSSGDADGDNGSFVIADSADVDFVSSGPDRFEVRARGGVRFVSAIDGSGAATAGVTLAAGSGAWASLSDRRAKADIAAVDVGKVLARVLTLPVYSWRYKTQAAHIRHLGPMAQDFHAAFGLIGDDAATIATIDPDGVALAAIQGLNRKLHEENAALQARVDALAQRLDALESRGAQP